MSLGDRYKGKVDTEQLSYEYNNQTKESEYMVGQGENDDMVEEWGSGDDYWNSYDTFDTYNSSGGGGGFSNFYGGMQQSQMGMGMGYEQGQQQGGGAVEDKIFDVMAVGCKGVWGAAKEIAESSSGVTVRFWLEYGGSLFVVGLGMVMIGVLGVIMGRGGYGFGTIIGGVSVSAVGGVLSMVLVEKGKKEGSLYKEGEGSSDVSVGEGDIGSEDIGGEYEGVEEYDYQDVLAGDEGEEDDDYSFLDELDFGGYGVGEEEDEECSEGEDPKSVLESLNGVSGALLNKQLLLEKMLEVLPGYKDFEKKEEYGEGDPVQLQFNENWQECCDLLGVKEGKDGNLPLVTKVTEYCYTIVLEVVYRGTYKVDVVLERFLEYYREENYDLDDTKEQTKASYVFGQVERIVGAKAIVRIFKGSIPLIGIKDAIKSVGVSEFLEGRTFPMVLGTDILGGVRVIDLANSESLLIAGLPRSGKSWVVQSIIFQLCALNSPKEVQLYIVDPKGLVSDYSGIKLPHIVGFADKFEDEGGMKGDLYGVLDLLEYIVGVEAPRRKEIISSAGKVNIKDYKKEFPNEELPYLYIVIDEMVTLSTMEKESRKRYFEILVAIITQYPNLGIRCILIPHRAKDNILPKTGIASIKSKILVRGDAEGVKDTLGTKALDFPLNLVGDMACSVPDLGDGAVFVHSTVITDSNDGNYALFDYVRDLWKKMEPEYCESLAKKYKGKVVDKEE